MVYAGRIAGRDLTLGVSGRLRRRNLVMWDPQTKSLWSQMLGKALHGPLKGRTLDMVPAQFVGLGTWRKLHPDTVVLDLPAVPHRGWHFTTADLAAGRVRTGSGSRALGIGLRKGDEALIVDVQHLQEEGLVQTELAGDPVVLAWLPEEKAAFVYNRRVEGRTLMLRSPRQEDGTWKDSEGGRWDLLRGRGTAGPDEGRTLARHPYIPSFLSSWTDQHPRSRVLR